MVDELYVSENQPYGACHFRERGHLDLRDVQAHGGKVSGPGDPRSDTVGLGDPQAVRAQAHDLSQPVLNTIAHVALEEPPHNSNRIRARSLFGSRDRLLDADEAVGVLKILLLLRQMSYLG